MAIFTYDTLDLEEREIRVVRFTNNPEEPLALDLQHKSRNDNIEYAAISYTWGDAQDTVRVSVNGRFLSIGRNLYNCLQQLRRCQVKSWLWADSICINQADLEEKRCLVAGMDSIFGNAHLVYTWLGLSSPGTDQVLSWVESVGSLAPPSFLDAMHSGNLPHRDIHRYISSRLPRQPNDDDVPGGSEIARFLYAILNNPQAQSPTFEAEIKCLLRREYWHRIWIIQEVALAKDVRIMCGAKGMWIKDFDTILSAVEYCTRWRLPTLHKEYQDFCCMPPSYDMISLNIRRQKNLGRPVYLQNILFTFVANPQRPHYSATDHRDLAFALVGVLADESRQRLTVDYKLSVEEVFTMITKAMLHEPPRHLGFSLDWCTPKEGDVSMPSWVPNWSQIGRHGFHVWPIAYGTTFNATAGMQAPYRPGSEVSIDSPFLRYPGYHVDKIIDVLESPKWMQTSELVWPRFEDGASWLDSIIQFARLGPESGSAEDYVWRSALRGYNDLGGKFDNCTLNEDVLELIRRLSRREPVDAAALSETQSDFIRNSCFKSAIMDGLGNIERQLEYFSEGWVSRIGSGACMFRRTFFKTTKMMLGVGHQAIKVGDIVTTLWGVSSPIILRKRDSGTGYFFVGDAYVDGIMHGEFQKTEPSLCDFCIY